MIGAALAISTQPNPPAAEAAAIAAEAFKKSRRLSVSPIVPSRILNYAEFICLPELFKARQNACPLWVKSRHLYCTNPMSALPPKADVSERRSGHLAARVQKQTLGLLRNVSVSLLDECFA